MFKDSGANSDPYDCPSYKSVFYSTTGQRIPQNSTSLLSEGLKVFQHPWSCSYQVPDVITFFPGITMLSRYFRCHGIVILLHLPPRVGGIHASLVSRFYKPLRRVPGPFTRIKTARDGGQGLSNFWLGFSPTLPLRITFVHLPRPMLTSLSAPKGHHAA